MNNDKKIVNAFYIKDGEIVKEKVSIGQDKIILYYDNSYLTSPLEINEYNKISVRTEILYLKKVKYAEKELAFLFASRNEFETALLFNYFECIMRNVNDTPLVN